MADCTESEMKSDLISSVNDPYGELELTPLHLAFILGHTCAVRILLDSNYCEPNAKDCAGATALHHAAVLKNQ